MSISGTTIAADADRGAFHSRWQKAFCSGRLVSTEALFDDFMVVVDHSALQLCFTDGLCLHFTIIPVSTAEQRYPHSMLGSPLEQHLTSSPYVPEMVTNEPPPLKAGNLSGVMAVRPDPQKAVHPFTFIHSREYTQNEG